MKILSPMLSAFKTGLILKSKTKKELKLAETSQIFVLEDVFCLDCKKEYLYRSVNNTTSNSQITATTVSPLNEIKRCDYKSEMLDMKVSNNNLMILNSKSLVIYSKSNFNIFHENFSNSKLIQTGSLDSLEFAIGVQSKKDLRLFDINLKELGALRCQCAYSIRDILLVADMNILKVFTRSENMDLEICNRIPNLEISLPDYITAVIADTLFFKIYCATQDNKIYVINLNGKERSVLDYHQSPVRQMKLSFCGKYLYSLDGNRICIWSTKDCVVIGYLDIEDEIEDMETVLTDEREYDFNSIII